MLSVRIALVLLVLWLGVLFNVERLHEPINLASFVYVLTSCLVVVIICIPKIRRLTLVEITIASLPVYALLKWYLGYEFGGPNLPITVTECVVICITNLLAYRVAAGIDEFVKTAAQAAELDFTKQPISIKDDDSALYEEVQRARRFDRKLSLATLSFRCQFSTDELDSILEKAKHEIVKKYIESRISNELVSAAQSGDLIAFKNGEFILLFPESDEDDVKVWIENVNKILEQELDVQLKVGIATFPKQECTLTGLIERAESNMTSISSLEFSSPEPDDAVDSQVFVK